jgi:hypothetical protein
MMVIRLMEIQACESQHVALTLKLPALPENGVV